MHDQAVLGRFLVKRRCILAPAPCDRRSDRGRRDGAAL